MSKKDDKILRVKKAENVGPEMTRITDDFIETYKNIWQRFVDIRIIATFVYFQAAAIIEEMNILTYCHQIEIDAIALPRNLQSREYALIKSMAKTLQLAL